MCEMKTIIVEMADNTYEKIIDYLKNYPDITFYDQDEDLEYTDEDKQAYEKSLTDPKKGEAISHNEIKIIPHGFLLKPSNIF